MNSIEDIINNNTPSWISVISLPTIVMEGVKGLTFLLISDSPIDKTKRDSVIKPIIDIFGDCVKHVDDGNFTSNRFIIVISDMEFKLNKRKGIIDKIIGTSN